MGCVKDLDAVNRRRVRVAASWCHHTSARARHTSSGEVGRPNSARDSTNKIVRSSQGFESQINRGGNHETAAPVAGCKEIGRWYGALSELPAWKKALPS